jgi:DNA polymerase-4
VLESVLGSWGRWIWRAAQGIDDRPVITSWDRQSYGREDTLSSDELDTKALEAKIDQLSHMVSRSLIRSKRSGRTITLKIKYSNFQSITRSRSLAVETQDPDLIASVCKDLLQHKTQAGARPVRLVGVSVSKLANL